MSLLHVWGRERGRICNGSFGIYSMSLIPYSWHLLPSSHSSSSQEENLPWLLVLSVFTFQNCSYCSILYIGDGFCFTLLFGENITRYFSPSERYGGRKEPPFSSTGQCTNPCSCCSLPLFWREWQQKVNGETSLGEEEQGDEKSLFLQPKQEVVEEDAAAALSSPGKNFSFTPPSAEEEKGKKGWRAMAGGE